MPDKALVPAYFSHSYRATDRMVNEFFVDVFYEAGFTLTVDPKSTVLSPPQLEMMMRDSACFVAVVTRRPDERNYRCSPFAVYEYGLAVRARKPRLLFVEHGVSGRPFMSTDLRYVFDREVLATFDVPHSALHALTDAGRPYIAAAHRTLGEVGLVLPETPDFGEVGAAIEELLDDAGYTPVRLHLAGRDAVSVAAVLDRLDFVVLDVTASEQSAWILPYLLGRAIPSIKLIRHDASTGEAPPLPAIATDRPLERASSPRRHAIWWTDPVELLGELALEFNQLSRPRRRFRDADDGKAYFRSLDRANGPVFISNAWPDNDLAAEMAQALQRYNIDFFHYQYRNTIPLAVSWQRRLLAKVDESRIFVALISDAYQSSEWCRREMERAEQLRRVGRLTVIPYFLDRTPGLDLPVQGAGLESLTTTERVARIVTDLQRALEEEARLRHRPTAIIAGDHRPVRPDVAVIASTVDHYRAMRASLDESQPISGTQLYPDRFSWATGTVHSAQMGRYRVVVGLAEGGPDAVVEGIRATADAFEPGAMVLLGPAHDLGPRGQDANVVVADRLLGFEYRDGAPAARPSRPILTDPSVTAAVQVRSATTTKVVIGPVACGNLIGTRPPDLAARVSEVWPEVAAVEASLVTAVQALETLYETRRLNGFSTIWTIGSGGHDEYGPAMGGATVLKRTIAEAWPRPPATDEPERSGPGVGADTTGH